MPTRMIREGWLDSHRIDRLDANGERFFLRLCLKADDFGRFHGSPQALRTMLFPLKEDTRSTDMPRLLSQCEQAGLVRCYAIDGKDYVEIQNFDQRLRAKKSKFPAPSDTCPSSACHLPDTCLSDDGLIEEKRIEEKGMESAPAPESRKPLCTIEQARSQAPIARLSPDEAEHWWHIRNKAGWTCGTQGGAPRLITSWQSDMSSAASWVRESFAKGATKQIKNNSNDFRI